VGAYLRVRGVGDWDGEPEALRTLCRQLDYLLSELVNRDGTWSASCDGISPATDMLPEAIEVTLPCEISLRGRAYWLDGDDESCRLNMDNRITPFFFSARLTAGQDILSEYASPSAKHKQRINPA
jgi:hypothetical protein